MQSWGGEVARNSSIDGVRGIAATTVLLQHGLLGYGFNLDLTPGARFVEKLNHNFVHQAGSIAVSMFFMITAYLFCGRLLRQSGAFDVRTFIIGRAWRLIPLYLVFVTIIIVYSFINGGGLLQVPPVVLLKQIILALSFGFLPLIELNGMADARHIIGPVWSLKQEWLFYGSLPFIAFTMRQFQSKLALYLTLFAVALFLNDFFYLFLGGIIAYQLSQFRTPRLVKFWQVTAIVCLLLNIVDRDNGVGRRAALMLIPLFVAVIQGQGLYELLGNRTLRFVGEISYSVYLMHAPVLYAATHWVIGVERFQALSFPAFVFAMIFISIAVIMVSVVTFVLVERPTMHRGGHRSSHSTLAST